jgi:glycosyltransferase involved in cell wall biosynthesis
MKIAHIVCSYPPYYGGMGNVVFQTASELSKLGHTVEVLTPGVFESKEIRPQKAPHAKTHTPKLNTQIDFATRLKPSLSYGNAARLPGISKELDRFDIVHLHYPFFGTANLVRKWKIKNPKKPLVITYHMDVRSPGWKGLIFKYYSKYWMPKILGSADAIIASSFDYIASSDAASLYTKKKEKWVALPFGVDTDRFTIREKPANILNKLNIQEDIPTLLFVGGMDAAHHFKGVPVLLKALYLLKEQGRPTQCVFVGDGKLRAEFELRAKGMGLSSLVHFVGRVSDEDLPYYYNLADLFVLPSVHQGEAFGMVLLEAMASGVPVIASDLPGVRTVAADGGMVVPPNKYTELAEIIAGFFSKKINHKEWQMRVRKMAEQKYAWTPIVQQIDMLYTDLLNK